MKVKSIVKRLTLFSAIIPLLFVLRSSGTIKKSKEYILSKTKVSKGKIEYNSGTIYIGNRTYLKTIDNLGVNDVLVLDDRSAEDPNLRVYNSYKIITPNIREEIIENLLYYEELYPTEWDRSKNSLIREWEAHNIMYWLGIKHGSTTDVDFNNKDENKYRVKEYLKNK